MAANSETPQTKLAQRHNTNLTTLNTCDVLDPDCSHPLLFSPADILTIRYDASNFTTNVDLIQRWACADVVGAIGMDGAIGILKS